MLFGAASRPRPGGASIRREDEKRRLKTTDVASVRTDTLPGTQSLRAKVPELNVHHIEIATTNPSAPRRSSKNTKGPHAGVVGDALVLLRDDVRTASAESTIMETAASRSRAASPA